MNHKFWIHVPLNARLQRGVFDDTTFLQPYRCSVRTEIPIKIDGPHLRR